MYAAMENKTALIDRMLDLGCDIHAKNKVCEFQAWLMAVSIFQGENKNIGKNSE